ncbi:hypothetical protein [Micromonospora endolithica]|uniref:Uncharacterized protein n=1 Tax=Micromonospora endolithica TaxID=230091 RepID=A0A3A9ZK62_9ACTN|nr:hypothetical protein [Micromonospora endolithica]RKN47706.1 hypothetical protein D7223_13215 [Micromonospora endolithica]TWJ21379.1 hypothetical protein JD76_01489 [Micromonospora endolithica]
MRLKRTIGKGSTLAAVGLAAAAVLAVPAPASAAVSAALLGTWYNNYGNVLSIREDGGHGTPAGTCGDLILKDVNVVDGAGLVLTGQYRTAAAEGVIDGQVRCVSYTYTNVLITVNAAQNQFTVTGGVNTTYTRAA